MHAGSVILKHSLRNTLIFICFRVFFLQSRAAFTVLFRGSSVYPFFLGFGFQMQAQFCRCRTSFLLLF